MKKKTKILFASLLLGASFTTVATGCSALKGEYSLTKFVVNTSNVTLTYEIGDTVDLTGLQMTATFSDDETKAVALTDVKIYLGDEDVTANLAKITETAGTKDIKVVYNTEYGEKTATFKITVNAEQIVLDSIDSFNMPAFLAAYKAQIAAAKNANSDPETVFFENQMTEYYMVGDDNAFKLVPVAEAYDEDWTVTTLTNVTVNSTVKMLVGNSYETLTKANKEGADYTYEYYQGETLLLTEYAAKNEFQFAPAAVGKIFNLSVLPDSTVYNVDEDTDAIVLEVEVVDGYNVYNTQQLSVLDNSGRTAWADYKAAAQLTGVNTNGVVLHATMELTTADIPDDFYYTLPDNYNIKYKDANGNLKTPEELGMGRTFLKQHYENYGNGQVEPNGNEDYVFIYQRIIGAGQTFNFYGNYFEVDASALPLVCSFGPTADKDGNTYAADDTWYGSDFSNAALFHIMGQVQTWTCGNGHVTASDEPLAVCPESGCGEEVTGSAEGETFYFDNLAIRGNAKSEEITVASETTGFQGSETLVRAGGLILTRLNDVKAKLDNVRNYEFFISFFANKGTEIEYSRTKCYDSFQNAIFAWGNANVQVTDSIFKRAGGPLVILQHDDATDGSLSIPHMTVDSASIMETNLTGTEIWFESVGATAIMPQFITLDGLFMQAGKTIFRGRKATDTTSIGDGKLNIVALLMQDATNAQTALGSLAAQGTFFYGDDATDTTDTTSPRLDRMTDTLLGGTIRNIFKATANGQTVTAPVFNIGNQVFFFDGTNVRDTSNEIATVAFGAALLSAKYIGFNQGGLSIMFELDDLVKA